MINTIKAVTLGHAVGDALGVPVEFCDREFLEDHPVTDMTGFGTYKVPAGAWSDDTSMSLCALESLSKGVVNYDEIMQNFGKWYFNADFTATDEVFDIGNTCYIAIKNYSSGHKATKCGCNDEMSNGNGSLMRIYPFVLYAYCNEIEDDSFIEIITKASSLTHSHQCSVDGCLIYAYVLRELLENPSKESVYKGLETAKNIVRSQEPYSRLLNGDIAIVDKKDIKSGGYVVDSLESSIWCLLTTENYSDCVLKAVNLGKDTDTVAAITGSLAGALYGIDSIPENWLRTLIKKAYIEKMCEAAGETWGK